MQKFVSEEAGEAEAMVCSLMKQAAYYGPNGCLMQRLLLLNAALASLSKLPHKRTEGPASVQCNSVADLKPQGKFVSFHTVSSRLQSLVYAVHYQEQPNVANERWEAAMAKFASSVLELLLILRSFGRWGACQNLPVLYRHVYLTRHPKPTIAACALLCFVLLLQLREICLKRLS
jgi:hypothetical protein